MNLKNRLEQLRPGVCHSVKSERSIADIRQRIQALAPGGRVAARAPALDDAALARKLGGECLAPGLIRMERRLPLSTRHGAYGLQELLAFPDTLPEVQAHPLETLLFVDTETTGLSGGTGTLVFLLGLARVEGDSLVCHQYLLSGFRGEQPLFAAVVPWLQTARAMVTYNGKSFDLPLLSTRARLARSADHFSGLPQLDLLHATRRAYGSQWANCRLATVEEKLLHFVREQDMPGAEAPQAWFDWVHQGRHERLPQVAEHNFWDLVSLVALLPILAQVQRSPDKWQADVLAFARYHIKQQRLGEARHLLQRCRAQLNVQGQLELAWLYRRNEDWQAAKAIWEPLAEAGNHDAQEWLSKYYEHVAKDLSQALKYAYALPRQGGHDQRRLRLQQRLAKAG